MKANFKNFGCLLLFIVFSFTACSTVNPHTEKKQTRKEAMGTGVSAAGNGGIGQLTADSKERQRNALIGAGLEGLSGRNISYYMDVLEAKLRPRLRGSGVSVTRVGNQINLNMPRKITFAARSADINADFYKVLDTMAVVLKKYNKTTVDVIGHTDSVGSAKFNQRLSERHARVIAEYLSGRGILPARLLVAGRGESQPVASNSTPEGRDKNRRVDIQVAPITAQ
jgi:outer membrane protein OmpA-like peptidoglycan-associated protein